MPRERFLVSMQVTRQRGRWKVSSSCVSKSCFHIVKINRIKYEVTDHFHFWSLIVQFILLSEFGRYIHRLLLKFDTTSFSARLIYLSYIRTSKYARIYNLYHIAVYLIFVLRWTSSNPASCCTQWLSTLCLSRWVNRSAPTSGWSPKKPTPLTRCKS